MISKDDLTPMQYLICRLITARWANGQATTHLPASVNLAVLELVNTGWLTAITATSGKGYDVKPTPICHAAFSDDLTP